MPGFCLIFIFYVPLVSFNWQMFLSLYFPWHGHLKEYRQLFYRMSLELGLSAFPHKGPLCGYVFLFLFFIFFNTVSSLHFAMSESSLLFLSATWNSPVRSAIWSELARLVGKQPADFPWHQERILMGAMWHWNEHTPLIQASGSLPCFGLMVEKASVWGPVFPGQKEQLCLQR